MNRNQVYYKVINGRATEIRWTDSPDSNDVVFGNDFPTEDEIYQLNSQAYRDIYEANKYQRDRVLEYPSIGDQLDMIYHSGLGGPEFQSAIKAVKDAHPKGGN